MHNCYIASKAAMTMAFVADMESAPAQVEKKAPDPYGDLGHEEVPRAPHQHPQPQN